MAYIHGPQWEKRNSYKRGGQRHMCRKFYCTAVVHIFSRFVLCYSVYFIHLVVRLFQKNSVVKRLTVLQISIFPCI
jgi:hypothetical protein